ncbi:glycosyltransferase [Pseudozyma hubeiensis SY62]|uniref:Mannosyltransferase n=1 Tax=Pseudozyma hubeiensis (strain SY62) TaxID=1305764 RepID=R9P2T8_PSEHS|nr:glycosyltransferase [Pseudozyma hubeiensis SY62]GAC95557.1 glycosyltransferase [Pseudozyma hubeiensis SY62]
MQAVHDILSYGIAPSALTRYDHQVFPGAVPRSFVGPLLLAILSYPFLLFWRIAGVVKTSADVQVVVRLCLAAVNVTSIAYFCQETFASASSPAKGNGLSTSENERRQAVLFLIVTAAQFHFAFWASRTIPNSLALPLVTVALAMVCRSIGTNNKDKHRVSSDARTAIWFLTFSAVVLRLEIAATLIPVGLYLLATRMISVWAALKTGIVSSFFSIGLTMAIDTYFWQDLSNSQAKGIFGILASSLRNLTSGDQSKPLWPELHALLFNVVDGKSSEWGVSPWHAYATSLIPKLLAFTGPLVVIGAVELLRDRSGVVKARARFLLLSAATHVAILSMLGHKEWRFAFYTLPALNVVAAIGAGRLTRSRQGTIVLSALLLLQLGLSWFTGYLSSINYPGGEALRLLHQQLDQEGDGSRPIKVHIDVLPAMTGVTLFQSTRLDRFSGVLPASCASDECWVYDKTEDLPVSGPEAVQAWSTFTHLITEAPECRTLQDQKGELLAETGQLFEPIAFPISSFAGLRRKAISQIKSDLLKLPREIASSLSSTDTDKETLLGALIRLASPIIVVKQPSVWLCRRKL